MLELKDLVKIYPAGGEDVTALKGISISFRNHGFISILGPSGCGKTTLLNIIGGLDQATSGELVIDGVSTREYKDRDWDAYRNHSIGFVFQSYNLIPHQSVLQNVELALTLSGVSKKERRERAKAALKEVGLESQMKKRPAEMSGGQMQRVAIARAIVNNPQIILADEPTGALDTETSIQVMDILKKISEDRLVIMVTHNQELAEEYSTRIVRLLDGKLQSDSAPLSAEELAEERAEDDRKKETARKKKLPSMSFRTSFGLSLKNLLTKKGRTILTVFAGSIGIIGIALIYAVSHGTTSYIDTVQEEALSAYPLMIEKSHIDTGSLMQMFVGEEDSTGEHENDAVYQKTVLYEMLNAINSLTEDENDLSAFKTYLEEQRKNPESKLGQSVSGVLYSYDKDLLIYTRNVDGIIIQSDTQALMTQIMRDYLMTDMSAMMEMREQMSMGSSQSLMQSGNSLWRELIPGDNGSLISPVVTRQYDLVYGRWPSAYDEVVLFVDDNNELNDLTLYALGLKSEEEIQRLLDAALEKKVMDYEVEKWSYEEICGMDFRTVFNYDCYQYDEQSGTYRDLRETQAGLTYLYDQGMSLKVSGIVKPKEDAMAASGNGSIGYTHALTEYMAGRSAEAEAVKAQMDTPEIDLLTGLPFRMGNSGENISQKAEAFREYVAALEERKKANAYVEIKSIPDEKTMKLYMSRMGANREAMENMMIQAMASQTGMSTDALLEYASSMSEEELNELFEKMMEEQVRQQYAAQVKKQLSSRTDKQLAAALEKEIGSYSEEQCATFYDEVAEFSDSTYEKNLQKLGYLDLDSPSIISLYASSFADKDLMEEAIEDYNDTVDTVQQLQYTDYVGLMLSSVTTIINAITYVLIAFVAVSLIVSSIMIGVITLISVQERTKEIGILRAIGASRKNVSNMFNAETVMIGAASGIFGVVITMLLCIPINMILRQVTGLGNLRASLPLPVGAVLILISIFLTLIAGIIPSGSAARKDPVAALRSE